MDVQQSLQMDLPYTTLHMTIHIQHLLLMYASHICIDTYLTYVDTHAATVADMYASHM